MIRKKTILAFLIAYVVAVLAISDKANTDYTSSEMESRTDSISETENDNVYNSHKQDSSDVNRDMVDDINSLDRKNVPEGNEPQENIIQGDQVEISDEKMNNRQKHKNMAESDSGNEPVNKQEQNKLEDGIEQLDAEEKRAEYKDNIETIEYDDVGDVNTEPVISRQDEEITMSHNENNDVKVHIDTTGDKDRPEVDRSRLSEEESSFLSEKVSDNENDKNVQESPGERRILSDSDGEENLNKVEASYEVLVKQETQPTETQQSPSNSENEGQDDRNEKIQYEEIERISRHHHLNDKNIPVEEDLDSKPNIIDTVKVSIEQGHSSNDEDQVQESESGQNAKSADEHLEKKPDLPVQGEFIKEMDESDGDIVQDFGGLENEKQTVETQGDNEHKNDAAEKENVEKKETNDEANEEVHYVTTEDTLKKTRSSSFYEFEYVERGRDEPESSNSPGVRESKDDHTSLDRSTTGEDEDERSTEDEKEDTTSEGEMLADEGSLDQDEESNVKKEDIHGQDGVLTDEDILGDGEGTLDEKDETLGHDGGMTDENEATTDQDGHTMGGENLSHDGSTTDGKEDASDEDGNMAKESISGGEDGTRAQKNEEDKSVDLGEELYEDAMSLLNNSKTKADPSILSNLEKAAYEHDHAKSQEYLGREYMFGDSVPQNFTKAYELFTMAANCGLPKAQQMLGFMYASGMEVNSSQSKALVYLTFSALGGETMAEMTLGYRHFSGITVQENCETALTYYRRVASKVVADAHVIGGPAVQRTRLSDEVDQNSNNAMLDEDLIQYYQFLADKGDVQAQVGLGQLHYQGGRGVDQDYARAYRYFQLAADTGNPNAYAFLGKMYLNGNSAVKASNETALKYFKKAADLGNPVGQSGVGLMYLHGKGVPMDYAQAIKYFKLAADQGWVDGQLQLGTMYYHGLGMKRDYKQAIKYFNFASQSGNIQAIYFLALMYSSGTGIVRSCRTSTELFKNVAERGRWSSLLMDAHKAYKSGNTNQALIKYAYLAELGYETAQSNVAFILDQDLNTVMTDNHTYPRALLYWTRAADQGNVGARIKVGDYYYYGQGTKVNYETAAFHYTVAQEQHRSAQAMFNLGYMHERGLGMKQDVHLAKRFYDMAAEASPDAQAPVTLALAKLAVVYGFDWVNRNYVFWSHFHVNMDERLGKDWDIYVMTTLAILVGLLILYRWRY
ncbi:protein sel-1 homolog 1-like isoform X2 [Dendronephthya gigantea]|uniref:protein sel-1 homolog 1-like isoform X2 n=1 Tax=Dendronephthya gigantea TaxID=151771 RepID=UPI00106B4B92|nr:protein sel-1 homolog 1-like isoform X2 [Dendronephthya gigantea]